MSVARLRFAPAGETMFPHGPLSCRRGNLRFPRTPSPGSIELGGDGVRIRYGGPDVETDAAESQADLIGHRLG